MADELREANRSADVRVAVVWIPMLMTDNQITARRAAAILDDSRVRQFYDRGKHLGVAYASDVFADCLQEALRTLPQEHLMRTDLEEWAVRPPASRPLWDAVLFYPAGMTWEERVPTPAAWAKQVDFFGSDDSGGPTGEFWRNNCASPPIESDWRDEVRQGLDRIIIIPGASATYRNPD